MSILDDIASAFKQHFQVVPIIVRSPGRINIIGEHTDYNDGFVLPAAIDKSVYVAMSLRTDGEIHLVSRDFNEIYVSNVEEIRPVRDLDWPNYVFGCVAQYKKIGVAISGFNAVLSSEVPIGAGLSSSAALECAVVFALNELLNTKLDRLTMVKMAQQAEHEYAGVMCGIMDQFASMMGKKNHLIQLDCRSLEYEYVPFKLDGYRIVLLNTNVKHSLASSEYNIRGIQCKQAIEWIKVHHPLVKALRDVDEAMLDEYVLPLDSLIDKRARYVVQEIERLKGSVESLKQGDLTALGRKMFETHAGLSTLYEVSCKELDWLVDFAKAHSAVIGARMMGGGFGGCTINLVEYDGVESFIEAIKPAYELAMGLPLTYYITRVENGTERVQ